MLTRSKKLLLSFFLSIYLMANFSVPFVHAQDTWYDQPFMGPNGFYTKVNDTDNPTEIFGERYTTAQVQWVFYGFIAFLINRVVPHGREIFACRNDEGDGNLSNVVDCLTAAYDVIVLSTPQDQQSGIASKDWTETFTNNPISSIAYFNDVKSRLHIVPEVKAQTGFGYTAAEPVIRLWRVVRNITYFLMVLVIIAMAFMIMFRVKLSPQTVISVQSALPKVVVALLLITFSYAIAGFVIDLMYVVMGLFAGLIVQTNITHGGFDDVWKEFNGSNFGLVSLFVAYNVQLLVALPNAIIMGGIGTAILGSLIGGLVYIIVILMLLIAFFRILWMLMKAYFMILVLIITGPIQILLGVFSGGGFGKWLRSLVAQVAVYPISGFLFFMAFFFMKASFDANADGVNVWAILIKIVDTLAPGDQTPFDIDETFLSPTSGWSAPYTWGEASMELAWLGVSLVAFMMVPKAAQMAQALFMGGRFSMESALGQGFAPMTMAAGAGFNTGRGAAGREMGYHMAQLGHMLQSQNKDSTTRAGSVARSVGRGLLGAGERSGAQVVRESTTGAVKKIDRGGTHVPGDPRT